MRTGLSFIRKTTSFLALFSLFASVTLYAKDSALDQILGMRHRPTMDVILTHLKALNKETIPVEGSPQGGGIDTWVERGIIAAPKLITAMEKTFPGATWVFVGRDSLAWADIFESFYLGIGQEGRVLRIPCSRDTLSYLTGNEEMTLKYLETFGLDPESVKAGNSYIFVDTVSKGYGQQLRTFVTTLYSNYEKQGGKVADILERVNIFGLQVSTFGGTMISYLTRDDFFKKEKKRYLAADFDRDYFNQHKILMYPIQPNAINELGYEHFTMQWHGSSGAVTYDPTTKQIEITLGEPNPIEQRRSVLWQQRQFANATTSQEFYDVVTFEALLNSYEFPQKRTTTLKSLKPEEALERARALVPSLIKFNKKRPATGKKTWIKSYEQSFQQQWEQYGAFEQAQNSEKTTAGSTFVQLIKNWQGYEALIKINYLLKMADNLYSKQIITDADLEDILLAIFNGENVWSLGNKKVREKVLALPGFVKAFDSLIKSNDPTLLKMALISNALLFLASKADCEDLLEEDEEGGE